MKGAKKMGEITIVGATETIEEIIKEKSITKVELAEKLNITKQNLGNKLKRDNFSALELVEIADELGMSLMLIPKGTKVKDGYIINYEENQKGKPKRKSSDDI